MLPIINYSCIFKLTQVCKNMIIQSIIIHTGRLVQFQKYGLDILFKCHIGRHIFNSDW